MENTGNVYKSGYFGWRFHGTVLSIITSSCLQSSELVSKAFESRE